MHGLEQVLAGPAAPYVYSIVLLHGDAEGACRSLLGIIRAAAHL